MRKSKPVVLGDNNYEVHEVSVRDMLPVMEMLADNETTKAGQLEMMKLSVFQDGKVLGDDVLDIGIGDYMELMSEVIEINGMELEGKDSASSD